MAKTIKNHNCDPSLRNAIREFVGNRLDMDKAETRLVDVLHAAGWTSADFLSPKGSESTATPESWAWLEAAVISAMPEADRVVLTQSEKTMRDWPARPANAETWVRDDKVAYCRIHDPEHPRLLRWLAQTKKGAIITGMRKVILTAERKAEAADPRKRGVKKRAAPIQKRAQEEAKKLLTMLQGAKKASFDLPEAVRLVQELQKLLSTKIAK